MSDLLLKLLGVRMEDAVHIAKASLAFRGGFGWGWFFLLLVAFASAIWWFYRNSPVHITRPRKGILAFLRVLFLGLLLLLLLRPVLGFTIEGSVRRLLVMLMDTSSSMQIRDPRLDSADQKRLAIARGEVDPTKGLGGASDKGRLKDGEQIARVDVVKAVFKNDRINLLPHLDKDFDLEAFAFAQGVAAIPSRKEIGTNTPHAAKRATVDQFTWVDRLGA